MGLYWVVQLLSARGFFFRGNAGKYIAKQEWEEQQEQQNRLRALRHAVCFSLQ